MMTLHEVTLEQMQKLWPVDREVIDFGRVSDPIIVAMWDGMPCSFTGFIPVPMKDYAYIWMQHLPGTARHKTATARHAKDLIKKALERWPKIVGHCNDEHSQRWLKSLGAVFLPHFMINSPPMFEIRR